MAFTHSGLKIPVCPTCKGMKVVVVVTKGVESKRPCPACGGTGQKTLRHK